MKLSTTETKKYAALAAKMGTGLTPAERTAYDALVVKMARREPRTKGSKKGAAKTVAKKS